LWPERHLDHLNWYAKLFLHNQRSNCLSRISICVGPGEALNLVVYALQNCVSWVAFDVGELARCEQPHMSQSQVYLARRMTSLYALGQLNHAIIGYLPLSVH
jgi:hypothetical protein